MKHIFYLCQNASDSLGLEKVLNFYNVISLEDSDAVEDLNNAGINTYVLKDYASKEFERFVTQFSYGEKPFILTNVESSVIKLSQLYDWNIQGIKNSNQVLNISDTFLIKFTIALINNKKVFGNIHKYIVKDYGRYLVEVLEWNVDPKYFEQIRKIVDSFKIESSSMTLELKEINGVLNIVNSYIDILPEGINIFTSAQVMSAQIPFILNVLYPDIAKEEKITFTDEFDSQKEIFSQRYTYEASLITIKSKYETIIKNSMPSGVWKFGGDSTGKIEKECIVICPIDEDGDKSLCLLHRGYNLYDITDKEGMVICTRTKGTKISSADSIASIKTVSNVTDSNNNLIGWAAETIYAILQYQL